MEIGFHGKSSGKTVINTKMKLSFMNIFIDVFILTTADLGVAPITLQRIDEVFGFDLTTLFNFILMYLAPMAKSRVTYR